MRRHVALFILAAALLATSIKAKKRGGKKAAVHEASEKKPAPSLEVLEDDAKVAEHQKKVPKTKLKRQNASVFDKKSEQKKNDMGIDAEINEDDLDYGANESVDDQDPLDWDFFFGDEFDEETEMKMDNAEWHLMDEWDVYMKDFVPEDMI